MRIRSNHWPRKSLPVSAAVAALAVAVMVGASGALGAGGAPAAGPAAASSPAPSSAAPTPDPALADGSRLFGRGQAVFVLPAGWEVDALHCGTPTANTVVTGRMVMQLACLIPRPPVDVVEVVPGKPRQGHAFGRYDPTTTIDGVAAEITPARCWQEHRRQLCRLALHVPSSDVTFVAEGPDTDGLDELLDRVRVLVDRAVVPYPHEDDLTDTLEAVGVEVRTRRQVAYGTAAGTVLGVSPEPGSVVGRGDVVTLTLARRPGPDDDARVWFRTYGRNGGHTFSDAEIRRGQRLASRVGHTIGLTSEGGTLDAVTATLDGTSVVPADGSSPVPSRFVVRHRGTTTMTIYAVQDGVRTKIGSVVVYAP